MEGKKGYLILAGYVVAIIVGLVVPDIALRILSHHWIYHTHNTLAAPAHIIIDIISPIVSDPENPLTLIKIFEYAVMFLSACATFSIYRFAIHKYDDNL